MKEPMAMSPISGTAVKTAGSRRIEAAPACNCTITTPWVRWSGLKLPLVHVQYDVRTAPGICDAFVEMVSVLSSILSVPGT